MIEPGAQVGDYLVVQPLGEGGMGVVYLGYHTVTGQKVAIKALHPALFNDEQARERFAREAQILARLQHPSIVRLLHFSADPICLVMEFADGEDLDGMIQTSGPLPPAQVAPWFVQVLRGLGYAHKLGIVHRDLKPANIKVAADGTTKLLDFGTAKLADAKKLTAQGMTLGTIVYMSKEQLLGKPLDGRSDVYSLGVTLYEATTGQLPFDAEDERKLVFKIAKEQPSLPTTHSPTMPRSFETIILKSMAKEPDQRYQSAEEFAKALEAFARSPR